MKRLRRVLEPLIMVIAGALFGLNNHLSNSGCTLYIKHRQYLGEALYEGICLYRVVLNRLNYVTEASSMIIR